jgi:hypothetical protein
MVQSHSRRWDTGNRCNAELCQDRLTEFEAVTYLITWEQWRDLLTCFNLAGLEWQKMRKPLWILELEHCVVQYENEGYSYKKQSLVRSSLR